MTWRVATTVAAALQKRWRLGPVVLRKRTPFNRRLDTRVPAKAHNTAEDIADRGARVNCTVMIRKPIVGARSPGNHGLLARGAALLSDVALQHVAALLVEYQGLGARAAVHIGITVSAVGGIRVRGS